MKRLFRYLMFSHQVPQEMNERSPWSFKKTVSSSSGSYNYKIVTEYFECVFQTKKRASHPIVVSFCWYIVKKELYWSPGK